MKEYTGEGRFRLCRVGEGDIALIIDKRAEGYSKTWRSAHGDLTDAEWDLIADLVPDYSGNGKIGRPPKHSKRDIVNAIFYVAATGCQWRALPEVYPNWNTVHRYHVTWSRDGTWEALVDRLREMLRQVEGHDPEPSVGVIDARSVRGASTVTSPSRGFDAGKKISGRKCFGIVDTFGLLLAVVVVAASASDNTGGMACFADALPKSSRLAKVFCDGGFKKVFKAGLGAHHVSAQVVNKILRGPPEAMDRRANLVLADE